MAIMTVTYRSFVLHVPATPTGLLPERWIVEHWCNVCRQQVPTDQLVAHAGGHAGGSVPPAPPAATMSARRGSSEEVTIPHTTH